MWAALISAVSASAALIIDKITLSRERVSLRVFLPISFILVFAFTLILVPFFGSVSWQTAMLPNVLFMAFLMIVIALAWNVLYAQSVQKEKIHEHEVIVMATPLITTLLAAVFFPEEYNRTIFILAVVASLALMASKIEKNHFDINQVSYNLFLAVVLMSAENILIRELLYFYTPVALYAVRTFFIAIFFMAYYRPRYNQVSNQHWRLIAFSSVLGVGQMIGKFYAFEQVGVIYTTLFTVLSPALVFLASWEFLHERIKPRAILSFVIIAACLIWASLIKFA